jgi:hypothetical protein
MGDKRYTVVYIAGNGHSGSTLLYIVLGTCEGCFSAGELNFIIREGLKEEYCSCSKQIKNCSFWTQVHESWQTKMTITFEDFRTFRNRYERNATFLRAIKNNILPSNDYKNYCLNTMFLFDAIHEQSGAKVIIDSSKSPQRIAVLKRVVDLRVVHLCREFKGVLNSAKHVIKKDISKGIEADSNCRRTSKVFADWLVTNLLCELFKIGVKSKKVFYNSYIENTSSLSVIHGMFKNLGENESFEAMHMLAGNHLHLKKQIRINKKLGLSYDRLTKRQLKFGIFVDRLFWFWH